MPGVKKKLYVSTEIHGICTLMFCKRHTAVMRYYLIYYYAAVTCITQFYNIKPGCMCVNTGDIYRFASTPAINLNYDIQATSAITRGKCMEVQSRVITGEGRKLRNLECTNCYYMFSISYTPCTVKTQISGLKQSLKSGTQLGSHSTHRSS